MTRFEESFYKMTPEQMDKYKSALETKLEAIRDERQKMNERKQRFNKTIDAAIHERDKAMAELTGQIELLRLSLNDEVPFELGPVDGEEDADWTDDEKLLLPRHLGGLGRSCDEYTVPEELIPSAEERYALAVVRPY